MTGCDKSFLSDRCCMWLRVAVIVAAMLAILLSGSLAPLGTDAAPPAQDPTANQIERVKTVFKNLGYVERAGSWLTYECPNIKELRFRVNTSTPFFNLTPGGEYVEGCVYVFPPESANTVPNLFDQEYAAMAKRGQPLQVNRPPGWLPQRFTIGNVVAAVVADGVQIQKIPMNTGPEYYSGQNKGILTCGTVFLDLMLLQVGGQGLGNEGKGDRLAEQMIPRSKEWMEKMTSALQAANACSAGSPITPTPTRTATPPATPTQAAAPFGVGHGYSYNEPGTSPGQLRCAATYTNALPNANIEYAWKLDGAEQTGEKANTFTRADKDIAPGTHTLVVVAKDTKNNMEASSSFTFTKPGGAMSVTVQCALRADDARAVACYADLKDAPDGAALTYEWTWNAAQEGESSRTLNKANLADDVYNISVRAKDSKSNKYTALASTSVTVGKPTPFTVTLGCQVSKSDEVMCSATPVAPPQNANIEYTWLWNGAPRPNDTGATLIVPTSGTYANYTVQVSAKDLQSGKSTAIVSAIVTVGKPASTLEELGGQLINLLPQNVRDLATDIATGTKTPTAPNIGQVAAATSAGALVIAGLTIINNLAGGGVVAQGLGNVVGGQGAPAASTAPATAAEIPPKPDTLPETTPGQKTETIPESKLPGSATTLGPPKPTTLPEQSPSASSTNTKTDPKASDTTTGQTKDDGETTIQGTPPPSEIEMVIMQAVRPSSSDKPTATSRPKIVPGDKIGQEIMGGLDQLTERTAHEGETSAQYEARVQANIKALKAKCDAILAEAGSYPHYVTNPDSLDEKTKVTYPQVEPYFAKLRERWRPVDDELREWQNTLKNIEASKQNKGSGGGR